MAKSKLKTYILSVVVLAIWGIIGYQIYSALNPSDVQRSDVQLLNSLEGTKLKTRDTFSIQNNYRDPFLGKLPENPKRQATQRTQKPVPADTVIFPNIQYKGLVQNAVGKEAVYSIAVDGIEYILSLGQEIQGVELISATPKEIVIRYQDKRKVILK